MLDFECNESVPVFRAADSAAAADIMDIVASMSDAELLALEDDLDFYSFARVPSERILSIMRRTGALDPTRH